jgi:transcriptional regulator with XRE-family HTH domain
VTTGVRGFDSVAMARLRKRRGLTLDALGELLGQSRQHLITWEKGLARPTPVKLVALAKALGVEPSALTTMSSEGPDLAALRAWAGLTQAQLAAAAGIPRPTYSALERGALALRLEVARRVATALGREPEEIRRAYERRRPVADAGGAGER